MVITPKDVPSALWLMMISDENKTNFINFDISDSLLSNCSRFHTIISKEKL